MGSGAMVQKGLMLWVGNRRFLAKARLRWHGARNATRARRTFEV